MNKDFNNELQRRIDRDLERSIVRLAADMGVHKITIIDVIRVVVKPGMEEVARGCPYVFQQDGAPAHTSKVTQAWLSQNLPNFWRKEVWPPRSPDCNPLDY